MLWHVAYGSAAKEPLKCDTLSAILDVSIQNNRRDGITGILLYHDQLFFQLLEGEKSLVERCFGRILGDTRHSGILRLWDQEVHERTFSDWAMGYGGPEEIGKYTKGYFQPLQRQLDLKTGSDDQSFVTLELLRQMLARFSAD